MHKGQLYFGTLDSVQGLQFPRERLDGKLPLILVSFSFQHSSSCPSSPSPATQWAAAHVLLEQLAHSWQELEQAKGLLSSRYLGSALIVDCAFRSQGRRQRGGRQFLLFLTPLLQASTHAGEVTSSGFKGLVPFPPLHTPSFPLPFLGDRH